MSWSVGVIPDGFEYDEETDTLVEIVSDYFNTDYRAYSIGLGCMWLFTSIMPFVLQAAVKPGKECVDRVCTTYKSSGTKHAWNVMKYTTLAEFLLLSGIWGMSYLKLKAFQKIYYRAIAWVIPSSWFFSLWVFIALLIGGS